MATALKIASGFFPKASASELEHIIWEQTGFPEFWNIPEDGKTPEQCFRKQLYDFKKSGHGCYRCGARGVPFVGIGIMCDPCDRLTSEECAADRDAVATSPEKQPPE